MPACVYTWGSTVAERAAPFPCDRHLPDADEAYFRAVDVAAPPPVVFRWLCQLKVAPYSYDWIDNLGRRSPSHLTPGLERLEVGQRIMTMFELVAFERDRHLTLRSTGTRFGQIAATYAVHPHADGDTRLVVKVLVRYPPGPLGWALRWLLPAGDLVMMRKQLLTFKALAEAAVERRGEPSSVGASARRARRTEGGERLLRHRAEGSGEV